MSMFLPPMAGMIILNLLAVFFFAVSSSRLKRSGLARNSELARTVAALFRFHSVSSACLLAVAVMLFIS